MMNLLFVSRRFRSGGVEKKINRLAYGFLQIDIPCTLILGEENREGIYSIILDNNKVLFSTSSKDFFNRIEKELSNEYENVILSFRSLDYTELIRHFRKKAKIFLLNGDYLSQKLRFAEYGLKSFKLKYRISIWNRAQGIITDTPDIAKDWKSIRQIDSSKVYAPKSPIVGSDVLQQSYEDPQHPWLNNREYPVVLGVGRLEPSKRFDLFIKALAHANQSRYVRGIILGQGHEYDQLIDCVRDHGLQDQIDFPGYVQNPYSWMRHADILLLTSRIEPLGWVLIESLFVGTPFVASVTPPGPISIQRATNCGKIVSRDTPEVFAESILHEFQSSHDPDHFHNTASRFDIKDSAYEHLEIIKRS